uniref:Uncharacterized protein n=1 Tax=Onchocerca volvulus TaxID=6282 RepID=A0A8R1TMG9_ONCVO
MVHPLERWRKEEFGEEVQERICIALGLTTCTEISFATKTTIKLIRTILFVMRFMAKVSGGKFESLTDFTKEGRCTFSDYLEGKVTGGKNGTIRSISGRYRKVGIIK